MRKILSLTSKDFLTGISPYPYDNRYGLFYAANNFNPYSKVGTIQPSKAAVSLSGEVVIDLIQNFVPDVANLYGMGAGGNFYKIANFYTGTPTVTNLRTTVISGPAMGLEVFQTKVGAAKYLYYWQSNQIGQWDLTGTYATGWTDAKIAISAAYQTAVHPTLRINDTIYYGGKYVISKIYDDLANADPAHTENILDLPTDHTIVSLETDGSYLIIAANVLNTNETKIYFWDYKNNLPTWTIDYTIKDTINKLKNVDGVIYAVGIGGLHAFNSGTAPKKIRTDIKNGSTALYNSMVKFNDGILISTSNGIATFGEVLPGVKGAFLPFSASVKAMIMPEYTTANNRLFYSSGTVSLHYQDILASATGALYQSLALTTTPIDLGGTFNIGRIDIIFSEALSSGQGLDTISLYGDFSGGTSKNSTFNAITYADYPDKTKCTVKPTNYNLEAEAIKLYIASDTIGANAIKRIDIYGEESTN